MTEPEARPVVTGAGQPHLVPVPALDEVPALLADPASRDRLGRTPHLLHEWARQHTADALAHLQDEPDSPVAAVLFAGLFTVQERTGGNVLGLPIAAPPRGDWADRLAALFRDHQPDAEGRAEAFRQFARPGGVLERDTDLQALHDWLAGPVGLDPAATPDLFPTRVTVIADELEARQEVTEAVRVELARATDVHGALANAACRISPLRPSPAAALIATAVGLAPDARDRTVELARALTAHCAPPKGRHDLRWLADLLTSLERLEIDIDQRRAAMYGGLIELTRRPGASPLDDDRLRVLCLTLDLDEHAPDAVTGVFAAVPERKRKLAPTPPRKTPGPATPKGPASRRRRRVALPVAAAAVLAVAAGLTFWLVPRDRPPVSEVPQAVVQTNAASPSPDTPPEAAQQRQAQSVPIALVFTVRYESKIDNDRAVAEFRKQLDGRGVRQVTLIGYSATAETGHARADDLRSALVAQGLPGVGVDSVTTGGQQAATAEQRGTVQFRVTVG